MSSAHRGLDVRIFYKECASLSSAGFDTHLVIVATPDEVLRAAEKGVTLHALLPPRSRFSRMLRQAWDCYVVARSLDADIYHFHDPELLPYGIMLSLSGKKVIYDVHEDVPRDILSKEWIPSLIRKPVSLLVGAFEHLCTRYFMAVATATPYIAQRFLRINPRTLDINNFPILDDFSSSEILWSSKKRHVCYIGGIAKIRGIEELVEAMAQVRTDVRLQLGGRFSDAPLEGRMREHPGWVRVDALGFLDRRGVKAVLERSCAGLVTLHPVENYLDALPVKMFEYMSAGVPVIGSNFPLWREIIEGHDCGLCVDPLDPRAIAAAIDFLVSNPDRAEQMGRNGQRAVHEHFNWAAEERKLLAFYERLEFSS